MSDKQKKIDKVYVLSDSSVNCYGFRLLTEGYQLAEYQKNAIGYYMHRREDGVALKWEDLTINGDTITGTPVINLCHPRGEQTVDEVLNGFLNAASIGHIVVLEHSTDPALMLEGQTGPTITKWYNKECSLVDIPGNANALTKLYDQADNELCLTDLIQNSKLKIQNMEFVLTHDALVALQLGAKFTNEELNASLLKLQAEAQKVPVLEKQLKDLMDAANNKEVGQLLETAQAERKITAALKATLAKDYAANPSGLKTLLADMPRYQSITARIAEQAAGSKDEATWTWDDYEKNDASGKKLSALRVEDEARYMDLYVAKFK